MRKDGKLYNTQKKLSLQSLKKIIQEIEKEMRLEDKYETLKKEKELKQR